MEWAATTSTIISILQYLSATADSGTYREFLPVGTKLISPVLFTRYLGSFRHIAKLGVHMRSSR